MVTDKEGRRRATFQAMPVVAMVLVVVLLSILLMLLHRNEAEEERFTLIKDILWVEQTIHFHLTSGAEKLAQLAQRDDIGGARLSLDPIESEVKGLMLADPAIIGVLLRGVDGRLVGAFPPRGSDVAPPDPQSPAPWADAFALARSTGRVAWTQPFEAPSGEILFEAVAPVFHHGVFAGVLVAIYSPASILTHHVPWWVAERYRIEICDPMGRVLAAKTHVQPTESGPSHQVRLEPPGWGMEIIATVYRTENTLARNLLAAAIFALALLAVWSLWLVRGHLRSRLKAEYALREEHAFRKAMEDSLTVGMRARDLHGRITYVNQAFCRMVGWSAEEMVGLMPPMPYWCDEAMEATLDIHRQVMAGHAPKDGFELLFRRRNGERFLALVYEAPLIDAQGRQTGWMASVVDVSERRRAEDMARQQQESLQHTARVIAMGEMASTLAHELNQPLAAIASYATGCLNRLDGPEPLEPTALRGILAKMAQQAQRAGQIIRRVHDFVRKAEPRLEVCSLDQVVLNAVGFIGPDARRRGVALELQVDQSGLKVEADPILLEQVVLNLVRNGIEAVTGLAKERRHLQVVISRQDHRAEVQVIDNGGGISHEQAVNLFQPFFTTKSSGMGMGLNICRSIVESHQGRLWFEPNPAGGSIFRFSLPLRDA